MFKIKIPQVELNADVNLVDGRLSTDLQVKLPAELTGGAEGDLPTVQITTPQVRLPDEVTRLPDTVTKKAEELSKKAEDMAKQAESTLEDASHLLDPANLEAAVNKTMSEVVSEANLKKVIWAVVKKRYRREIILASAALCLGILMLLVGVILMAVFIPSWDTEQRWAAILGIVLLCLGLVVLSVILALALILRAAYLKLLAKARQVANLNLSDLEGAKQQLSSLVQNPGELKSAFTDS